MQLLVPQVTLVLRWVDDDLASHEFMGLYQVPTITSATLVSIIKDSLIRFNLSVNKARGQCYDGASNMTGRRNGVVTQIQEEEPRALFTHCYGHSLNLAASDMIMGCTVLKAAFETTHEIVKLNILHAGKPSFVKSKVSLVREIHVCVFCVQQDGQCMLILWQVLLATMLSCKQCGMMQQT